MSEATRLPAIERAIGLAFSLLVLLAVGSILFAPHLQFGSMQYLAVLPASALASFWLFVRSARRDGLVFCAYGMLALMTLVAVIHPMLLALLGSGYRGRLYIPVTDADIGGAISVLSWSFVAASAAMAFIARVTANERVSKAAGDDRPIVITGNRLVYAAFILLSVALLVAVELPPGSLTLAFVADEVGGLQASLSPLQLLTRQFVVIATALVALWIIERGKRAHDRDPTPMALGLALFGAVLFTSLVVGDRRSVQVMSGLTMMVILSGFFPDRRKTVTGVIAGVMVFVILLVTATRLNTAGAAGATATLFGELSAVASNLQIYWGGIESIATNIAFADNIRLGLDQFAYDLVRSIFLLNFLFKDELVTTQLYNLMLYERKFMTGQLLFASGYGRLYFGAFAAPIVMIANVIIAAGLERWSQRTRSLEFRFLALFCLFRVLFLVAVATPQVLTVLTLNLFTFGAVFILANLFRNEPASSGSLHVR